MATPVIGTCRLCLRENQVLRDSHVLSKWKFGRARGDEPHPDPVMITNGRAFQTSKQVTEYLFCDDCEQMLGVDENYASTITYQEDGSAPIFDHVLRQGEVAPGEPTHGYPTSTLDCESVLRFGSGVLWRGHLARRIPKCSLLPEHAEAFRLYLLGHAGFPADAACPVTFIEDRAGQGSPIGRTFASPVTTQHAGFENHRFWVYGLLFEFVTGSGIPDEYREFCFARADPRVILLAGSGLLLNWLGPDWSAAKRTGVLARRER